MNTVVTLKVPGIPAPGGSKKAFWRPGMLHANIVDAGGERTKNWRAVVALSGREQYRGELLDGCLRLNVIFVRPRLKSHFRKDGRLKPTAPHFAPSAPDTTKLLRSTEDALTGIVWRDDARVVDQHAKKVYGDKPGAFIEIEQIEDPGAESAMALEDLFHMTGA